MKDKQSLMHIQASQFIGADFDKVFDAIQYENIPKWSSKFKSLKVSDRNGNKVVVNAYVRVMGIKFQVTVNGIWDTDKVTEEILISDGTITKESVTCVRVPGGTRVDWSGDLVKKGKIIGLFGPLIGFFFRLDVQSDFRKLARYVENN